MRRAALLLLPLASTLAFASDCPNGDNLLKNNTPLGQLCSKGFGQFSPGSLQQAIGNQPNNVAMVTAAAEQQGVPVDLALAVSYHESEGFNSCAGSDTGVKGPMQLTQRTGNGLGYNRDVNEQNIMGGMKLLKQCDNKCGDTAFPVSLRATTARRVQASRPAGREACRTPTESSTAIRRFWPPRRATALPRDRIRAVPTPPAAWWRPRRRRALLQRCRASARRPRSPAATSSWRRCKSERRIWRRGRQSAPVPEEAPGRYAFGVSLSYFSRCLTDMAPRICGL